MRNANSVLKQSGRSFQIVVVKAVTIKTIQGYVWDTYGNLTLFQVPDFFFDYFGMLQRTRLQ